MSLPRYWEGCFNWTNGGNIGAPFQVRVTSVLGDVLTLPTSITDAQMTANAKFYFNSQFPLPTPGYGGSSSTPCVWPGPDPHIYVDGFGGDEFAKWGDWRGSTTINFADSVGCYKGNCISWNTDCIWAQVMIGYLPGVGAPASYYTNMSFWVKAAQAGYNLDVSWEGNGTVSSPQKITGVPTTWTQYVYQITDFWPGNAGFLQVFHVQTPKAIPSDRFFQFDEILLGGITIDRVNAIASPLLAGPPPVGFPGYTGPGPNTYLAPSPSHLAAANQAAGGASVLGSSICLATSIWLL